MMKFVYWKLNNRTDTVYCSVVVDGKDGGGLHFEKFIVLNFFKVPAPIFKAKPKIYPGFILFLQKID